MSETTIASLKANRFDRILAYGLFVVSAVIMSFAPNAPTAELLPDWANFLFISVFAMSSIMCFLGSVFDWWVLEYMGLMPMLISFAIVGIARVILGVNVHVNWSLISAGLCIIGFAMLFKARRIDLALIYKSEISDR